jgi:hypothetical protein
MLTDARGEDYALVRSELEVLPTGTGQQAADAGDGRP